MKTSVDINNMSFSPDCKHIAFSSGNGERKLVVMTVEGTEVCTESIDGNYKGKAGLHWWNTKTVMVMSDSCGVFCNVSSNTREQWWGPPKGVGTYTHEMKPNGARVMKSGKFFVAHRDDALVLSSKKAQEKRNSSWSKP